MKRIFKIIVALICFSNFSYANPLSLGDQLNKIERSTSLIANEAKKSGSEITLQIANELAVIIKLLKINYNDMLDKTLTELDPRLNTVLNSINKTTKNIEEFGVQANCFYSNLLIDTRYLLNDLPFVKMDLSYVQGINAYKGLEFHQNHNYDLIIKSSQIKPNTKRSKNESLDVLIIQDLDTLIKNKDFYLYIYKNGELTITFDSTYLSKFFKSHQISRKNFQIQLIKTGEYPWFFQRWWYGDKVETQNLTIPLSFIPSKLAKLKVTYSVNKYGWTGDQTRRAEFSGPWAHCEDDCHKWAGIFTKHINAPTVVGGNEHVIGYERILSVSPLKQIAGPGGYDNGHSVRIVDNGRRIEASYNARTTHTTYEYFYTVQKYDIIGTENHEFEMVLQDDFINEIKIPSEAHIVTVQGLDIYNNPIYLEPIKNINNNPNMIKLISNAVMGPQRVIALEVDNNSLGRCQ